MHNGNQYDNTQTISKYDRLRGGLKDVATWTKPTTIQDVQTITGTAETYIITTARNELGDYIFVEYVDCERQVTRLAMPPRVADAINSQRDSLTTRRRSAAAQRRAAKLTDEQRQVLRDRLSKARQGRKKGRKKTA